MLDHLALLVRLHCRDEVLAADRQWRRLMCRLLGHEWRPWPFQRPVCVRCEGPVVDEVRA